MPGKMQDKYSAVLREPGEITAHCSSFGDVDPKILNYESSAGFWEVLEELGITVLVSREYEHLLIALRVQHGKPAISYMVVPHPSGIVVDRIGHKVHVASTRNPNVLFELGLANGHLCRRDVSVSSNHKATLVPIRTRFLAGALYLHDLALVGGCLYGNSVGQNAIVKLEYDDKDPQIVWWPRCIETARGPVFSQNFLQLNSIAPGATLKDSFFSASCENMGRFRPGHDLFSVDKRGVIFSGLSREPVVRGLTRPHSARIYRKRLWVNNSGYGQVGYIDNGSFEEVYRFAGWTRGLTFSKDFLIVGTSTVIPRFRHYAPGLDSKKGHCGVHILEAKTGRIRGFVTWPLGNQIFAIDWMSSRDCHGLPYVFPSKDRESVRELFYSYTLGNPHRFS